MTHLVTIPASVVAAVESPDFPQWKRPHVHHLILELGSNYRSYCTIKHYEDKKGQAERFEENRQQKIALVEELVKLVDPATQQAAYEEEQRAQMKAHIEQMWPDHENKEELLKTLLLPPISHHAAKPL